jgi:hypothetical protein
MNASLPITAALFAMLCARLVASPLDDATVSRVVHEVTLAAPQARPRGAAQHQVVRPDDTVRVGARSRAELRFPDHTLARLGAETELALRRGTRELTLARGTLLLEVPGFRGGARVRMGSLTAVCGAATILVEHLPAQSVKLMVLAGDLRVCVAGFLGDSIVIPPGKMLITTPEVKRLPDPVDVDLSTLVKTSALINAATFAAGAAPLASLPRIEREIARQADSFKAKRLIPTNLAIVGSGTSVVIPGQPDAESTEEPIARGNSAIVDGRSETAAPNPAGLAVHRELAREADRESPLPEP